MGGDRVDGCGSGLFNADYLNRYASPLLKSRPLDLRPSVVFFSPFARRMLSAKPRVRANIPGLVRMRLASSGIETSRTEWFVFSTLRRLRMASSAFLALTGAEQT